MRNLDSKFFFPIVLTFLILGFILGRLTNGIGRYSYDHQKTQLAIFDSKTGKVHVKDTGGADVKYFVIDVINGDITDYKPKATK